MSDLDVYALEAAARDVVLDYGDRCCDNASCACSMARLRRLLADADAVFVASDAWPTADAAGNDV